MSTILSVMICSVLIMCKLGHCSEEKNTQVLDSNEQIQIINCWVMSNIGGKIAIIKLQFFIIHFAYNCHYMIKIDIWDYIYLY